MEPPLTLPLLNDFKTLALLFIPSEVKPLQTDA